MFKANDNYLKLPGDYLFSEIASRIAAYGAQNPDKAGRVVRLGIGDVTQPLAPSIVEALHAAVDEMGDATTFRGYAPDLGYDFLRETIAECDFKSRGALVEADEVFVSDGAKSDCANIQEIFSADARIAVCDPVYPVYVDSNVMAGRTGMYDAATGLWSDVEYMPCTREGGFTPRLPDADADVSLVYLCFPNNPTGAAIAKPQLQAWVDYANEHGAVIVYDAAYEAYQKFLEKRGFHGHEARLYGRAARPEGCPWHFDARLVGSAPWHEVQRCAIHRAACGRGCLQRAGPLRDA